MKINNNNQREKIVSIKVSHHHATQTVPSEIILFVKRITTCQINSRRLDFFIYRQQKQISDI